jgi:tetratricopeptide (TPR) repeat protein
MEKGMSKDIFSGEDLTRAQRTLDSAKRRADEERKKLGGADAALAATKSGEDAYTLGKLYFSDGKYAKSAAAMRKAIATPGLEDVDDAHMQLGIALARDGKKADAIKAFDGIKDPKFAEVARLWKLRLR